MNDRQFYGAWIGVNAGAEGIGLGTTLVLAWTIAPSIDRLAGVAAPVAAALLAIVLGAFLEGVVVGVGQELVLRSRLPALRRSWTAATVFGAALAWALGMIPSTVAALASPRGASSPGEEPSVFVQMLLALGLGLVAGPVLGAAQWFALRRFVDRAGRWLWANAIAWATGMPLIFLGMDAVPWKGDPMMVALWVYGVCTFVGAIVGAIHGAILIRLLDGGRR